MARVPEGAELIPNPTSGAPGVKIGNVYILAGVPHIAASMLEALTGKLEGGRPMVSVTVGALRPKATSPICCARPRRRIRAWRSAAIPFFKDGRYGANFVIRSDDGDLATQTARIFSEGSKRPATSRSRAAFRRYSRVCHDGLSSPRGKFDHVE